MTNTSQGFSGAEVEQAVVSALYVAHTQGEVLATTHILAELQRTRPLSVVMAERIAYLRAWAADRTVKADCPPLCILAAGIVREHTIPSGNA